MTEWTAEQQREHRKLWVEALRSGKYQQSTRHNLHDDHGFCCLGVACEISVTGKWVRDDGVERWLYVTGRESGAGAGLPNAVTDWLGLRDGLGMLEAMRRDGALYLLNDQGVPFEKLAEIIESEPVGLLAPVEA